MAHREKSEPPLAAAVTERINPRTRNLDRLPLAALLECLLAEDARVASAVHATLPAIAAASSLLLEQLRGGGRWFNLGAGTSGRIGVLDAAEIPPTYGLSADRVQAILAGGPAALSGAVEGAEDDSEAARHELAARELTPGDALLALSASGETPFTLAGLRYARERGVPSIGLTCNPDSSLARESDRPIVVEVGPEAIAGSTRMKGGLAQRMVLQLLSTAVMVQLGRVRGNLMTHLGSQSRKLRRRGLQILMELSGADRERAARTLADCDGNVDRALDRLLPRD